MRYNGAVTEPRGLTVDEVRGDAPDTTVLALAGELDLATITLLKDAVTPRLKPGGRMVLDLAALMFCDSTGLGAFVALHREARAHGAEFVLVSPRKRIANLFAMSGIDQVIPVQSPEM